jgi:hypothetical protein
LFFFDRRWKVAFFQTSSAKALSMAKLGRAVGALLLLAGRAVSEAPFIETGCPECEFFPAELMGSV